MKPLTMLLAVFTAGSLSAQIDPSNPTTAETPSLVSITPNRQIEESPSNPTDEGTNNPIITGSTEYIQGEKKYYIKSNEQITIIFEEKTPQ